MGKIISSTVNGKPYKGYCMQPGPIKKGEGYGDAKKPYVQPKSKSPMLSPQQRDRIQKRKSYLV